ncbi:fluoride efflux transporter CrcB [Cellulomonas fengjieae]|uniref:Fluoride-specific ion channel FluC n=1 Tax=Cellulomonas fengjieae TaxID=2819978 RepID=A0ABS3SEK8_9CELL|nr:fluoride efflux transporter CrcB [Cellulomonas fengjieae]MBO3084092.1 fluoride efflux transporter CrcB [Cellulomonas fengjieae]QVI64653.1 fluoride efflux transporter CrcB [Cellulomonas fengjieae]
MSVGEFLLLIVAGGAGAVVRYLLDDWIRARASKKFPWSTAIINMTGSLVLGVLTGLVVGRVASTELSVVLATGFLAGYTTFGTASYETVQLVRERKYGTALLYGIGILLVCVALAFVGYRWGTSM